MSKEEKRYYIGMEYPLKKQARLKRFVDVMGIKNVGVLVAEALEHEMANRLAKIPPAERRVIERMISEN